VTLPDGVSARAILGEQTPFVAEKGGSCGSFLVTLAKAPAAAKADYDYPQTRAALHGHAELTGAKLLEVTREGQHMLVAQVDSREAGTALLGVAKKVLPGAHSVLACETILPLRAFDVDVATGAVRKIEAVTPPPGIAEIRAAAPRSSP
jgi:hypothetical protein